MLGAGAGLGHYGFALNQRHAPELGLLDTAMRQADYFLAHLPASRIACWDLAFGDNSGEPWDSSASAIAVCGMLELAAQLPLGERRSHYESEARAMLDALCRLCAGSQPASGGLQLHGVYHKRGKLGVDEANLWGDYYYLEALARYRLGRDLGAI